MANGANYALRAACECGTCVIEAEQIPTVRFNCHCTICQSFTGKAYSDVMILPASRAVIKNEGFITYKKYKKFRFPPPNLNRGRCKTCGFPFVETWGVGPMKVLLFIRAVTCERQDLLPQTEAHLFYERRVADMNDGLPRYEGYFPSQWATAKMIMRALHSPKKRG